MKQADIALRLYDYFLSREAKRTPGNWLRTQNDWSPLEEKMREQLRLRQRSLSTGKNLSDLTAKLQRLGTGPAMIYTHVASKNILGVRSPLDQ